MRGNRKRGSGRLLEAAFIVVLVANAAIAVWGLLRAIWP
jgi:hypothetical protein